MRLARLRTALIEFGMGEEAPTNEQLMKPQQVFMLGRKPWRIDILTGIDGVSFEEAWEGRLEVDFYGVTLFIIGRDALLKNKRASGRRKDLLDVALLETKE